MMNDKQTGPKEIFLEGIPASSGVAVGFAYTYAPDEMGEAASHKIDEDKIKKHLNNFEEAKIRLVNHWQKLKKEQKDDASKKILSAQIEIINDPELNKRAEALISEEQLSVREAVRRAFDEYIEIFSKSGSPRATERLTDITDIRDRLIEAAVDKSFSTVEKKGDIVVTKELSPREIISLSHQGLKGIVMERGGSTSHTSIIARSLGIPAVTGVEQATEIIGEKTEIGLNGRTGTVYVNPSKHTRSQIKKMSGKHTLSGKEKKTLCRRASVTADGHPFTLRGNIEFSEELSRLQNCKAEGVGLLRTEAIYLNQSQFKNRKNQQLFYEDILEKTDNKPLTIRLFDVGGDKFLDKKIKENNPFLGWRGIRMLLDERDLLREQLLAVLAAAGHHPGRVKLLLPMVTMVSEIDEVKNEIGKCKKILADEGRPLDDNLSLGIMVEIPNTAIQSARFAREVDFFSIGTNDLIQYLLAVDRGNPRIAGLYNQIHPVMWQMIDTTVTAARSEGIDAEVCGELAGYPTAAACLVGLGIDGLSMTPASILNVKKLLVSRRLDEMKKLADKTLQCTTLEQVETLFEQWTNN